MIFFNPGHVAGHRLGGISRKMFKMSWMLFTFLSLPFRLISRVVSLLENAVWNKLFLAVATSSSEQKSTITLGDHNPTEVN